MESLKSYLTKLNSRESDFRAQKLLEILDSFSESLYNHLKSEIESLLALSRFSTTERPFDLVKMALEAGKKSVTMDFAFNVLPVFLLNMEHIEFEGGMWFDVFPPVPRPVKFILIRLVPLWQHRRWQFASCDSAGKIKPLAA
jgi:hypothetical protein